MHPEGWKQFTDTLKSPYNLIMMGLAVFLLVDYVLGSPVMAQLVQVQLRIQKINPASEQMKIFTIFGTFSRVDTWTRFIERVLMVIFFVLGGLAPLRGFYSSLSGK